MKKSELAHLVEPLREMIRDYSRILDDFRRERDAYLACSVVEALPAEIAAAFNVYILPLPLSTGARGVCAGAGVPSDLVSCYDGMIVLKGSVVKDMGIPIIDFTWPGGYGEDAAAVLHEVMDDILQKTSGARIKELDVERLQAVAEEYDGLRRVMRGIAAVRRERPFLLSNADLLFLFEAAVVFPPVLVLDKLTAVRDACNASGAGAVKGLHPVMIYAGPLDDAGVLDDMEEMGYLVAEDDHCNGRRQFDISLNAKSDYLYYEILDACSYRPLCPSLRRQEERFDLLYRLLRNYDIETVVFLQDRCCAERKREMEYLRVRLMRIGVDPVVTSSETLERDLASYRELLPETSGS